MSPCQTHHVVYPALTSVHQYYVLLLAQPLQFSIKKKDATIKMATSRATVSRAATIPRAKDAPFPSDRPPDSAVHK